MLDQTRRFCHGISVNVDKLDPFQAIPRENSKDGPSVLEKNTEV